MPDTSLVLDTDAASVDVSPGDAGEMPAGSIIG